MLFALKEIRKSRGLTQEDVASALDIPLSTYRNWEQLKNSPKMGMMLAIADYMDVTVDALIGSDVVNGDDMARAMAAGNAGERPAVSGVPVVRRVSGDGTFSADDIESYFPLDLRFASRHHGGFFVRMPDDSMNRAIVRKGIVLIDPSNAGDVVDGSVYAVSVNGDDAVVRRVRRLSNGIELMPDSTDPTIRGAVYDFGDDGSPSVRVIGRAVWFAAPYDVAI